MRVLLIATICYLISACVCHDHLTPHRVNFLLYQDGRFPASFSFQQDVQNSYFFKTIDPTIPTHVYMHGFLGTRDAAKSYCFRLLTTGNFNCIAGDWTNYAHNPLYYQVKSRINDVALETSDLIEILVQRGLNLANLTLVGHSLGAHLCGKIGRSLSKRIGNVGTIIGLDPAGPGFSSDTSVLPERLDKSDAEYVLVLHTDVRKYGIKEAIGHADIYANWGENQPNCFNIWPFNNNLHPCSHCRAQDLFFESLRTDFPALHCKQLTREKGCEFMGVITIMGPNMVKAHGLFYLETNGKFPFVIPNYRTFQHVRLV